MIYKFYIKVIKYIDNIFNYYCIPFLRRIIRFVALPMLIVNLMKISKSPKMKYKIIKDILYIFFKLKYYPSNYLQCRLWEQDRENWKYYYGSIYEPYQRALLRKKIQPKKFIILFHNKHICYLLCKALGFPVPETYDIILPHSNYSNYIYDLMKIHDDSLIIKPINGSGGEGVCLVYKKYDDIIIQYRNKAMSIYNYKLIDISILQKYVKQIEVLNNISRSINTIRIVTFLNSKNESIIIGSYIRFGTNHDFVDNLCEGGIGVGIDTKDGKLLKYAYNRIGEKIEKHPISGFVFENFLIPFWDDTLKLVKRVQDNFYYYRMIGHDIALTNNGPVIIELNDSPDMVDLEMICGPILAKANVLDEFFINNLIVNKKLFY